MPKIYWNKARTSSVILDKIKEYTITANPLNRFDLRGWYNRENCFIFGTFDTEDEARSFLNKIHNIIMT